MTRRITPLLIASGLLSSAQVFGLTYTAQYAFTPDLSELVNERIPYMVPGNTLTIPKLNDPNCVLTGVKIVYEAAFLHRASVDNNQLTPTDATVTKGAATLSLTGPSLASSASITDPSFSHTFFNIGVDEGDFIPNYTGSDSATEQFQHFSLAPVVLYLTGSELSNFIGVGNVAFLLQGNASSGDTGPGNVDLQWRTYAGGRITVSYVCPDSTSLGLIGIAGLALAGYRRIARSR